MLNKEQIRNLIEKENLIENYIDCNTQLTPNGFDLTAAEVFAFTSPGSIDFSNSERVIPQGEKITSQKKDPQDRFGWWHLSPGVYKVRTNEKINMPSTLTALAFSRTSLLRMGAFTQNGVWDAGFRGVSEFILVVGNQKVVSIKENARIIQLIFVPVAETEAYNGIYQNFGEQHEQ